MNSTHLELSLPATTAAPRVARRALAAAPGLADPDLLFLLRLLLTELVTNAVRHAGLAPEEHVDIWVETAGGTVSVRVADHGDGASMFPAPPGPERGSGRGLLLMTALADRWGLEVTGGTTAWFELDCDGSGRPLNFDAALRRAAESAAPPVPASR